MKKTALAAYLGLAAAFLLPLFWDGLPEAGPQALPEETETSQLLPPSPTPFPTPFPTPSPAPSPSSKQGSIRVKTEEGVVEMDMQEYLVGVVAAEMPASFEPEALKAQAVAARTYALYCADIRRHSDAQVCTSHTCCQSWNSDADMTEKWGADYEKYRERVAAAVEQTAGQYLSYGGKPVFAAFHSSSCGATEDSGRVWNSVPYLVSVSSPETAAEVPELVSTVSCTPLDFRDTVLYAYPDADFTGDKSEWIGRCVRDPSGRVDTLTLGGQEISGTTLRSLFKLRSAAFELSYTGDSFVFTVTGYGHGVGMSQYGANVMACQGANYAAILAHYYQSTELCTLS